MSNAISLHGSVVMPLELMVKEYSLESNQRIPINSDVIETGGFVTTMAYLLCCRHGHTDGVVAFLNKAAPFLGAPMHRISQENAMTLFREFQVLFDA